MSEALESLAYRNLRRKLLVGELPTDRRLSESSLARQLGMSRTPVRHALRKLENEGLLYIQARSGTYVRPFELSDLREYGQIRTAIEGYVVKQAAELFNRQQIAVLRGILDQYDALCVREQQSDDPEHHLINEAVRLEMAFHLTPLLFLGNQHFVRIARDMHLHSRMLSVRVSFVRNNLGPELALTSREHRAILAAIESGDGDGARRLMEEHILSFIRIATAADQDESEEGRRFSQAILRAALRSEQAIFEDGGRSGF